LPDRGDRINMPLYISQQPDKKMILFINIPKTGGGTIQKVLEDHQNGLVRLSSSEMGMGHHKYYYAHWKIWREWPKKHGEIGYNFAVIRNPYTRLESIARMQGISRKGFEDWLKEKLPKAEQHDFERPFIFFRPMEHYVDHGTRIFRYEDGIKLILHYLTWEGVIQHVPDEIPNIGDKKDSWAGLPYDWQYDPIDPESLLKLVNRVYENDFKAFNYRIRNARDVNITEGS